MTEPLSAATLEGLAALHQPIPGKVLQGEFCAIDRELWPCQTARLLATIKELREALRDTVYYAHLRMGHPGMPEICNNLFCDHYAVLFRPPEPHPSEFPEV